MPPRALSRPPFAGIGSGSVQFPSPQRPASSQGRPHTPSFDTPSSATPSSYHRRGTTTSASHPTPTASSRIDYRIGSSAVSESLSKAYFYDVVLEAQSTSASIDQDQPGVLLPWLGSVVVDHTGVTDDDDPTGSPDAMPRSGSGSSINAISPAIDQQPRPDSATQFDPARFQGRVQELIDTERSYIRRIEALHQKYAVPLRRLAKDRDTAIIPIYEAQRLFGNIGEIVGANQAFLNDLDALAASGPDAIRAGLGDVVYRHMSCFSCYTDYLANFEKAKHIERTLAKHRGFQEFADRTKYAMVGLGNVGIRDLLMEPVQRIPRYKLLLDGIIKHMGPRDPQRGRLEDAVVLASRIASCEADDKTKRAAVLWSFSRNVDDFPAGLISVHRQFLDCVDVDDFPLEALAAMGGATSSTGTPAAPAAAGGKTIHCTLFLFDDRLAIAKRASSSICGRKAVGLDDLNRLADQMKTFTERSSGSGGGSGGGGASALLGTSRKGDLSFRGVVDILDLEALDLGGSDFQLNFLRPPSLVSGDRWTGRPVRQYVTVDTASAAAAGSNGRGTPRGFESGGGSDMAARLEKTRFLESLWRAKALFKAKEHRSHVRCQVLPAMRPHQQQQDRPDLDAAADHGLDALAAREAEARRVVYWNVYTRRSYLTEPHKAPLALHVNFQREADPLPLGPELAPAHAALEVVHVDDAYGECQMSTRSKLVDPERSSEVTVVQCSDLPLRMAQLAAETARLMGGQMRVHTLSQPATPSSSGNQHHRTGRLEQFGRSLLFGGSAGGGGSGASDVFGSPARRTKSNASKSTSAYSSSDAPSTSSRAMTFSTNATSVSSRAGMLESIMTGGNDGSISRNHRAGLAVDSPESSGGSGGGFLGSPRRLMKKRRSSSVGPPSMAASERSPSRGPPERMSRTRGPTPEPGYISTANGHLDVHGSPATPSSQQGHLRSSRLGGGGHQRAKTESFSASIRSPLALADAEDVAYRADVSREPSTSTQGSSAVAAHRHARSSSSAGHAGPVRATTPLNIRRKPPPREDESEDEERLGVSTPAHTRTPSGPRGLPSANDATPTASRPATKRDSLRIDGAEAASDAEELNADPAANGEAPGRPSLSESETSTERGHGGGDAVVMPPASPQKPGEQVIPKRSTSSVSRQRGVEEARKRARAVEDSVRSIRDEVKRLKVENVGGAEAGTASMRRSVRVGAMQEADLNTITDVHTSSVDRLLTLIADLEARLSSSMRMNERLLVHPPPPAGSSSSSSSTGAATAASASATELSSLRAQVATLQRKCDLLTTLETDGRMENTELHKAFNEELDAMYDDTQRPESDELARLRDEIKRVKRQRNEVSVANKKLHRDLELERVQCAVYREMLEENGLL
ncbi:uncharacterized protein PFL1_01780 [Pseudozyma flocculosa PF-1]|uniref:DH domain-containing protein n=1 Tax=Pseudozyma flocculosa TaxID=84751 RepID=A0A5C3EZZ3_9BASI|nr:uncharacterized protein PFL1_01780 [Pseudozyma flocculosa PF-1]EPQ30883.1 hypothetical protein PFL1_01780 [Pseudozyma flocculosa PF-1]SPO36739.1 uncharacterized protein PSFLO_02210 [Pseudozyma flocculosa]